MFIFLHKLWNPHCPDCKLESLDKSICQTCEVLKNELASVKRDNQELLRKLLYANEKEETKSIEIPQPIGAQHVPWAIRRHQMEQETRVQRNLEVKLGKELSDIPELEKELKLDIPEEQNARKV